MNRAKLPFTRTLALCLLALAGCGRPSTIVTAPHSGSQVLAFGGVTVIGMTPDAVAERPDQTVVIQDGHIKAVGTRGAIVVPPGAVEIDGTGKYLMPGLADMHVHLEYFEDPTILQLFLANGVTTVRNMDGRPYIVEWKRQIERRALVGPTIYTAGPLLDGDPPLREPEVTYISSDGREFWKEQLLRTAARMDDDDWRRVALGKSNRLSLVRVLHESGVPLLAGTDTPNPFVVPGFSLHEELNLFVEAGLTTRDALAAATRQAARFAGESGAWGTVETGKRADLLLLDENPLADIRNTRKLAGVVARGRWFPREELTRMLDAVRHAAAAQ